MFVHAGSPKFISTGVAALDRALGGGWAVGRLTEVWGLPESVLASLVRGRMFGLPIDVQERAAVPLMAISERVRRSLEEPELLIVGPFEDLRPEGIELYGWTRQMSGFLRQLLPKLHRTNIALVVWWRRMPHFTEMGGGIERASASALKFYSSARVGFKVGESAVAAKVYKNKMAPPFQEARFTL